MMSNTIRPIGIYQDRDTRQWVVTSTTDRPIPCETWPAAMTIADRILADLARTVTPVPAYQARRRLRALQAQGYAPSWLAGRLDVRVQDINAWSKTPAGGKDGKVSPTVGRRIKDLYDWLDARTGGKILATGPTPEAVAGGWCPPAAWEDIDDIHETAHRVGTTNEQHARRRRIPITEEIRAIITRTVDEYASREWTVTNRHRRQYKGRLLGVPTLAARIGVPTQMILSILDGNRASIPAEDLDRIVSRLGLLIDEPAAA